MVEWQWSRFEGLASRQVYEILQVRQQVFVVEQECAYQDADGLDWEAWHLCGWENDGWDTSAGTPQLQAYLRVLPPGGRYPEPAIGRVLTAASARGSGLGRELMRRGIALTSGVYPDAGIRISAQLYLQDFYHALGFEPVSEPYPEDGIPHIEMLRGHGA